MRNLRLMDERDDFPADGLSEGGMRDEGVGGKGPSGGGKGDLIRVGEAGIEYSAVPLLFVLPWLELLRCVEKECRLDGCSSGRGGRLEVGGCIGGGMVRVLERIMDSRKDLLPGALCEARIGGVGGAEWFSPGVGGSATLGAGRGGGGIDARWDDLGLGPCENIDMAPMPVARDCVVLTVLKLCTDPADARLDESWRGCVSGLCDPADDVRLSGSPAAYGCLDGGVRVLRPCGDEGGVAGGGPYGGLNLYG